MIRIYKNYSSKGDYFTSLVSNEQAPLLDVKVSMPDKEHFIISLKASR